MNKLNKFLLIANAVVLMAFLAFAVTPRTVVFRGTVDSVVHYGEVASETDDVVYSIENLEVIEGLYFHSLGYGVGIRASEGNLPDNPEVFYCPVRGFGEIYIPDCHF